MCVYIYTAYTHFCLTKVVMKVFFGCSCTNMINRLKTEAGGTSDQTPELTSGGGCARRLFLQCMQIQLRARESISCLKLDHFPQRHPPSPPPLSADSLPGVPTLRRPVGVAQPSHLTLAAKGCTMPPWTRSQFFLGGGGSGGGGSPRCSLCDRSWPPSLSSRPQLCIHARTGCATPPPHVKLTYSLAESQNMKAVHHG